jgi:hypothetical protein
MVLILLLVDETTKVRIEAQISDLIPPLKNGSKTSAGLELQEVGW